MVLCGVNEELFVSLVPVFTTKTAAGRLPV